MYAEDGYYSDIDNGRPSVKTKIIETVRVFTLRTYSPTLRAGEQVALYQCVRRGDRYDVIVTLGGASPSMRCIARDDSEAVVRDAMAKRLAEIYPEGADWRYERS